MAILSGRPPRYSSVALVTIEAAIALVLALLFLGRESFWMDETLSVFIAEQDLGSMWDIVREREANMSLYYLLLHFWLGLGHGEAMVRLLSVVFAVATIPATCLLGTKLFGRQAGLIAGVVMLANPFWLHYAQEARGYSLAILLVVLSAYLFIHAVERPSPQRWLVYVLVSALAVYAHFFAAFVVAAQVGSLLLLPNRESVWRQALAGATAVALLSLPLLVFTMDHGGGHVDWIPAVSPRGLVSIFTTLTGGRALLLPYFLLALLSLIAALRLWRIEGPSVHSWRIAFLLTWLAVPVAAVLALSLRQSLLLPRYFAVCLPALVLLGAEGLQRLREWRYGLLLVIGFVLLSLAVTGWSYEKTEKQDWRGATSYVMSESRPDDAVLFYAPVGELAFDYYRRRMDGAEDAPDLENYATGPHPNLLELGFGHQPESDPALARRLAPAHEQVWLVLSFDSDEGRKPLGLDAQRERLLTTLAEAYRLVEERDFLYVRVLRYQRAASDTRESAH